MNKGRCIKIESLNTSGKTETQITLIREGRVSVHSIDSNDSRNANANLKVGDWIALEDGQVEILTPNQTDGQLTYLAQIFDPHRQKTMRIRQTVEASIRDFFNSRDFLETRTPLLVSSPGMEPHIRPFEILTRQGRAFLPTSPEFAMKKLLAGGIERLYQISPVFRNEPYSTTHHPEFTMLEWYRAFAGEIEIQTDTENLIAQIAQTISAKPTIAYQGRTIDVSVPWPRFTTRELFKKFVGLDIGTCRISELTQACGERQIATQPADTWDDLYFRLWLNEIEPKLPSDRAFFITRYPASQAALAKIHVDGDGTRWAKRFEAYAGGLELGNAFEELTDPHEQRARFIQDMELRRQTYGDSFALNPIDEDFILALREGIPPSGGIAIGVDRLVMLFADETDISKTFWLPSFSPDAREHR